MSEIEKYLEDLNRVKSQWRANWVLPYGIAYSKAFGEFCKTLDDQKKADAVRAQIAVTVLTLAIGGPICGMMGKSAVSAGVYKGAVEIATRRNWERTVAFLSAAGKSPAAEYLAGEAWSAASSILTDKAKDQVGSLMGKTTPAGQFIKLTQKEIVDSPLVAQNKLERYLELAYVAAHLIGEQIRDSSTLTTAQKDAEARKLRKAPFFKDAPAKDVIKSTTGNLDPQLDMELCMYMLLVMNCDFKVTGSASVSNGVTASYSEKKQAIRLPTTSKHYPEATSRIERHYAPLLPHWRIFQNGMTRHYTEIRYESLGGKVMERIGKLYKRHYTNEFKVGVLDGNEVWRAERCIDWLGEKYHRDLKKQIKTP